MHQPGRRINGINDQSAYGAIKCQYVSNFETSPYETKRQRVMNEMATGDNEATNPVKARHDSFSDPTSIGSIGRVHLVHLAL